MATINQDKQLRVAFYVRVSTEEQVEKYGQELQFSAMEAYLKSRGKLSDGKTDAMVLAGESYVYKDRGISGTVALEERPAFFRLQEDIRKSSKDNRPFDVVAVYKIDRFARKLKILLDVIEFFDDFDIGFISTTETIDTSSAFGRAILGIVGVLAELELETIKERTNRGKAEALKGGSYMGNSPPYGYIKDKHKRLIILDVEAEVVKQIFDYYLLERLAIREISRELEKLEILSPSLSALVHKKKAGRPQKKEGMYRWNPNMIGALLRNEVYIGKYYYPKSSNKKPIPRDKWVLQPKSHPSIIDAGVFERVQKLLKLNAKSSVRETKGNKSTYLLASLIKCTACYDEERDEREGMQTWHGERKKVTLASGTTKYVHSYRCRRKKSDKSGIRCPTIPLPAEQIEKYVTARVLELLEDPKAVFDYQKNLESSQKHLALLKTAQKHLERSINGKAGRIENLKEQHTNGIIKTTAELTKLISLEDKKTEENEEELRELKGTLAQYTLSEGYLVTLKLFNEKYQKVLKDVRKNKHGAKRVLKMLIDSVVVHSRDTNDKDVIAGRKSKGQQIPYRIDIKLRLPKEYLLMLKAEVDSTVTGESYPPVVTPVEITDRQLKMMKMTRKEYKKDYEETIKNIDFGGKDITW